MRHYMKRAERRKRRAAKRAEQQKADDVFWAMTGQKPCKRCKTAPAEQFYMAIGHQVCKTCWVPEVPSYSYQTRAENIPPGCCAWCGHTRHMHQQVPKAAQRNAFYGFAGRRGHCREEGCRCGLWTSPSKPRK